MIDDEYTAGNILASVYIVARIKASTTAPSISFISAGSDPNMPDPIIAPMPVAIQAIRPNFFLFSLVILSPYSTSEGAGIASTNFVLFISGCSSLIAPSTGHWSTHAPQ